MEKLKKRLPNLFVSNQPKPFNPVMLKNIKPGVFQAPNELLRPANVGVRARIPEVAPLIPDPIINAKTEEPIIKSSSGDSSSSSGDIPIGETRQIGPNTFNIRPTVQVAVEEIKEDPVAVVPKKVNTRKIKINNGVIANVNPSTYAKFGQTPLSRRLPEPLIHHLVAHPIFMNNRKLFIKLTNEAFGKYREEGLDASKNVSCENLKNSGSDITLLNHQNIIRDYMNLMTPYRGLLLYHGLGAGKTCSSIAIAEGFKTDKQVLIMTPASLNANYMEELKKCGDEYYKKQQFWEWISVENNAKLLDTLSSILRLPKEYINRQGGAWVVDITKPNNYETLKRGREDDTQISKNQINLNNQLDVMITNKYEFINYNGIRTAKYNEMSAGHNIFSGKVVIIDEAHNLVSRIVNQLNDIVGEKQVFNPKARKLVPMAVNIYKDLMDAVDVRIVLLTGTPIINYPNEIGVLFNILRGYIKTYEFTLTSASRSMTIDSIKQYLRTINMMDYIDYNPQTKLLTITTNPFGFETIPISREYKGVVANPRMQYLGERQFPAQVEKLLEENDVSVTKKGMKIMTALPDTLDKFKDEFIESQANNMYEFRNPMKFKKRIIGLTSYFRSAQEELLPRYDKAADFEIVHVPMSDHQFQMYEEVRSKEREQEDKSGLKKGPQKAAAKDMKKDMKNESSSTFKVWSRLLCNFATPQGLIRPSPSKRAKAVAVDKGADEMEMVDAEYENDRLEGDEVIEEMQGAQYNQDIKDLLQTISADPNHLTGAGLAANSPKMMSALHNIQTPENDGLHLVYSQFRTFEGIEIFSRILNANGFAQFKIKTINQNWGLDISPEDMQKPKYALYTGTESTEEREILRNIYNGSWKNVPKSLSDELIPLADTNNMGQHIKVLMITAAGSEGINLFNTRFVHLIDPYWHNVRLEQVVGRARRICSHQSLPIEKQTVHVFLYLSVLTEEQWSSSEPLMRSDISKLDNTKFFTSDQSLYEIACIKENLNVKLLHAVKEASIDCATHVASSAKENLVCLNFGNLQADPDAFAYVPDISKDVADDVYKQNVILIKFDDYELITRKRDGVKQVRQKSTGLIYTIESFNRAKQTKNIGDLIISTD